jgi:hypothetical protein
LVKSDDGAFPQRSALNFGIALGIAVEQDPRGLQFVQVQVVGHFQAVVDEVFVDRVLFIANLDLA